MCIFFLSVSFFLPFVFAETFVVGACLPCCLFFPLDLPCSSLSSAASVFFPGPPNLGRQLLLLLHRLLLRLLLLLLLFFLRLLAQSCQTVVSDGFHNVFATAARNFASKASAPSPALGSTSLEPRPSPSALFNWPRPHLARPHLLLVSLCDLEWRPLPEILFLLHL